ncbi:MAG: restriction endonuclease subunit S [Nitrospirae bacterium]|nr:restriction endonuclease subunit S [Nitrospirota bacterium]
MKLKIKDIADIQIGYQFRKRIKTEPDGSHAIIQMRDFDDRNNLIYRELSRVRLVELPDKYLVNKNDVLFLSRGHSNFAFAITDSLENTIAASYFFILKVISEKVLPEYLAWCINQAPAQKHLHSSARRGTHMPLVPKSAFEDLKVHVPDIKTQKSIVELSRLLDKESGLIKKIQEKRSLLIRSLSIKAAKTGN